LGLRVTVGRVGPPRGLEGEVYVRPESDAPDRFRAGAEFLTDEPEPRLLRVSHSRLYQDRLVVQFEEVADRTAAESLRGVALTIRAEERRALAEDEFWPDELVGLNVCDPDGKRLGSIAGVEVDSPQVQLLITTADGGQWIVPFVRELVPAVRLRDGVVIVDPIEGLFNPLPD
jgi:16S rRNA processing protein RimM